jgi:Xaa-Pro dipeptidase
VKTKEARLAALCRELDVDGVHITRRANIEWIADGADVHCDLFQERGVAELIWTPARRIVLTDNIEAARLRQEEFGQDFEISASNWWESRRVPLGRFASDAPVDIIAPLRYSLTPRELERARELGHETAKAVQGVMHSVRTGTSEHEVAGDVLRALRRRGIHTPVCLVAADDRIARYRHPIPTARRFEQALLVGVCARRHGLTVSLSRLLHIGPLDPELAARHLAVTRVDTALHAATRPGARWGDILAAGIRVYAEHGFGDEWRQHHQGGPMGYATRDFLVTPQEERVVQPDQLVGWNPSISGTKSEDTLLSCGEVITQMDDWPMLGTRPDFLVRAP